jgi:hypothetical protein
LNPHLQAFHVVDLPYFTFAVHAAQAERRERDHMCTLHGLVDHVFKRIRQSRIGERFLQMVFGLEQEVERHNAGLGGQRRCIRRR